VLTPDGGAEVYAWDRGRWRSADFPAGDVMKAPPALDWRLKELGIPIEEDPSELPLSNGPDAARLDEIQKAYRNRTGVFCPRDVSGIVARLELKPEGGARIIIWDGSSKSWVSSGGAVDGYELLAAAPASDRLMAELGIPTDRRE
jgi:hypothetical protein